MKNAFKTLSLIAIAIVIVLSSCKKEDETKTPKDNLTDTNWKVTGITISPGIEIGGVAITDFFNLMTENCNRDDLMKFNTNGTITEDEGATKCDPDDPQTETDGTWTLSEDGKALTIKYPDEDAENITIVSLSETNMVVSNTVVEDFGVGINTYTLNITLVSQ